MRVLFKSRPRKKSRPQLKQSLTAKEASHVKQFLLDAGYQDEALPDTER
jgi:hypothetical protein